MYTLCFLGFCILEDRGSFKLFATCILHGLLFMLPQEKYSALRCRAERGEKETGTAVLSPLA